MKITGKRLLGWFLSMVLIGVMCPAGMANTVSASKDVVLPDYIDQTLWNTKGFHAYLFYQVDGTWDYRNSYVPVSEYDAANGDSYWFIKAGGSEVSASDVKVQDVLLTADGTYTVSIKGIDLSGGSRFNMLGVSTDIDTSVYSGITVDQADIYLDDKSVKNKLTLTANDREDYYRFIAVNCWDDTLDYPVKPDDLELPEESISIRFRISGLPNTNNDNNTNTTGKSKPEIRAAGTITKRSDAEQFFLNESTTSDGDITYQSSDESIVTVSGYGVVTVKRCGTARITITTEETNRYYQASKTVKVMILPGKVKGFSAVSKQKGRVLCKWSGDKKVNNCEILFGADKRFDNSVRCKSAMSKKKMTAKIQSGKKCYVRMRTYAKINGKTYYGSWTSVKQIRVK